MVKARSDGVYGKLNLHAKASKAALARLNEKLSSSSRP